MNRQTLARIEAEIGRLRDGAPSSGELVSLAIRLKRKRDPSKKRGGSHQTYISTKFRDLRPVQIPIHGDGRISKFTARDILHVLETDVARWRLIFDVGGVHGEEVESEDSDDQT